MRDFFEPPGALELPSFLSAFCSNLRLIMMKLICNDKDFWEGDLCCNAYKMHKKNSQIIITITPVVLATRLRKSNNEAMWTPEIIEVGITATPTVVLNGLIVYSHDTRGA